MMFMLISSIIGAVAILTGFIFQKRLSSINYYLLNVIGSMCFLSSGIVYEDIPIIIVNIVWWSRSIWGLLVAHRQERIKHEKSPWSR